MVLSRRGGRRVKAGAEGGVFRVTLRTDWCRAVLAEVGKHGRGWDVGVRDGNFWMMRRSGCSLQLRWDDVVMLCKITLS